MDNQNKKKEGAYAALTGFHRAVPIILIALAVFVTICFFTQEQTGRFGIAIAGTLKGLFSIGGYFIPVLFAVHAFFYPSDIQKKKLIPRIISSVVLLMFISAFTHAISTWGADPTFSAGDSWDNGKNISGGGFIGAALSFAIISVIGHVGLIILGITVFAIYITYFLAGEDNPIKNFFRKVIFKVLSFFAKVEKKIKKSGKEKKVGRKIDGQIKENEKRRAEEKKEAKRINALKEKEKELYDDEFFEVDNGLKELKIQELGIEEARSDVDIELNPTLQNKVIHEDKPETDSTDYESVVRAKRGLDTDYGIGANDVSYTVENDGRDFVMNETQQSPSTETKFAYGLDDSAENVFGSGAVTMDFAANEKIAAKQSTMGPTVKKSVDTSASDSGERVFSEADIAAARRRVDFELRKAELRKQREIEEQERARAAAFRPTTVEFDINPDMAPPEPAVTEEPKVYAPEPTPAQAFTAYTPEPAVTEEPKETSSEADDINYTENVVSAPIDFSFDDDNEEDDFGPTFTGVADIPVSDSATEFTFGEDDDEDELPTSSLYEDDEGNDSDEPVEIPPEKRNPQIDEYRKMFSIFDDDEKEESDNDKTVGVTYASADTYVAEEEDDEPVTEPADKNLYSYGDELNDDELPRTEAQAAASDEDDEPPFDVPEPPKAEKPDYSKFQFPPIDILKKGVEEDDPTIEEEIAENGDKLIDSLAQFDVRASIKSVDRGPRITRYEIVPARGVRVSRVISLFDDIALNLAAEGIRMEAPIPGKSAIGVEIPNKHPSTVYLRDLIESDEFMNEPSKTFACFGKDVTGNPIFGDIAKMPHILIAGATGMGKSVCINSILISILYRARPDEVKFIMVDPKTVEFTMYNGIPHLLVPVVTDAKQAAGALMWAIDEMNRRYELMAKHEVRKLDSYNELVKENPALGEPLPKIIIVIDELNDLMQQVRKPVEGLITNITQKARAAGIHMIIGTQRPSVDVITGVIKANVPSRVSCKVTSLTDSRTILDQAGAEKLLDKGDMLFAPVGKPKPLRVQGAFVSDGEVDRIMKFLKSNISGAIYDEKALEEMTRAAAKCTKGKDSDDTDDDERGSEEGAGFLGDKQFLEAVDLAIRQGKISTSLIQRKISVGYGKAAKFIDIMEDLGVVSEPNGQKPRDVLVTKSEWEEMLARRSLDD